MKFLTGVLLLALVRMSLSFVNPQLASQPLKQERKDSKNVLHLWPDASAISPNEVIVPVILMAGAIWATIKYASESPPVWYATTSEPIALPASKLEPVVKLEEDLAQELKPVPEVKLEEDLAQELKPVPELVLMPAPDAKPEPIANVEPLETKSISEIRREVARTKDTEASQQILTRSPPKEKVEEEAAAIDEEEEDPAPIPVGEDDFKTTFKSPTGRKRRLLRRIFKKAIAPWRKWENIK